MADVSNGIHLQTKRGKPILIDNEIKKILQFVRENYVRILNSLQTIQKPIFDKSWFNISGVIYFYENGRPYFAFTNFARYPVIMDNQEWPTSEYYYQAQKFTHHPNLQEAIRKLKTPRESFDLARSNKNVVDADWQKRSVLVMFDVIRAKFN